MSADAILSRLEKVKRVGDGVWQACCPSHDDRSPSLRIRETDDGKILVKCFAGCGASEIVGAVGLTLESLFPEKLGDHVNRERSPFSHREAMNSMRLEVTFLAACSIQLRKGEALSDKDHERLMTCASRLIAAADYCNGGRS
jgi:hypothetical protein